MSNPVQSYFDPFKLDDLFEPKEERDTAEAEAGNFFFFLIFLFEPSLLNDPEAVAVFFIRVGGGVSDPEMFHLLIIKQKTGFYKKI